MSNMTFGVNLIPDSTNTRGLGNADKKWNIYANQLNGKDVSAIPGKYDFAATIPTTGWTVYGSTDLYTITITVNGLTADDKVIMGVAQTGTESTDSDVRDAYGLLVRGTTGVNSLTLYATDIPEVAIPVQMVVLR